MNQSSQRATSSKPWATRRVAVTLPPPSARHTTPGSSRATRPSRSPPAQAAANAVTSSSCCARVGGNRGRPSSTCRRAREASCRTAEGDRPTTTATSANDIPNTSCSRNEVRSAGRQPLQDHEQRHAHRLIERDPVRRVAAAQVPDQRLGQPRADVALAPRPCAAQHVQGQPGDRGGTTPPRSWIAVGSGTRRSRSHASCTQSSASASELVEAYASRTSRGRCASNVCASSSGPWSRARRSPVPRLAARRDPAPASASSQAANGRAGDLSLPGRERP